MKNRLTTIWKIQSLLLFFSFIVSNIYSQQFNVLLFSKTQGFRHESIIEGVRAIKELGNTHNFYVWWTEDANAFNDSILKNYDVVVFLNTSGDILNSKQQNALVHFVREGKGFVGIHGASTTEYDWLWYGKLVGRYFIKHPPLQTAIVNVEDADFPATYHIPKKWVWTDEWYEFKEPISDSLHVLLSVNLNMLDTKTGSTSNGKPDILSPVRPIAWYQYIEGGRSFYTSLGHLPSAYNDIIFLNHLFGGIYWAANKGSLIKN